jgi:hypothetical protein
MAFYMAYPLLEIINIVTVLQVYERKFHFSAAFKNHSHISSINMQSLKTRILIALKLKNTGCTTFDLWQNGSMKQLFAESLNKYWF